MSKSWRNLTLTVTRDAGDEDDFRAAVSLHAVAESEDSGPRRSHYCVNAKTHAEPAKCNQRWGCPVCAADVTETTHVFGTLSEDGTVDDTADANTAAAEMLGDDLVIVDFKPAKQVDPTGYRNSWYLVPNLTAKGLGRSAPAGYAKFIAALQETKTVAQAMFARGGAVYRGVIEVVEDVLVFHNTVAVRKPDFALELMAVLTGAQRKQAARLVTGFIGTDEAPKPKRTRPPRKVAA
jgi:hypothetical protein